MKRHPHWIKPNKAVQLPQSCVWVDTETLQDEPDPVTRVHRLAFGWACYQRTYAADTWTNPAWWRFTTREEFWDRVEELARAQTRLYLFAHNWAFDAPVLGTFTTLPDRGWTLRTAIVDSPPVILRWRREKATIEMIDTLNWWRMSLAKIGESLGCAKLPMPDKSAPTEEWDTYCKQDVEVIRRALHAWWDFLREHDLGGFAPTLAGQAFRAYRHRFMEHQVLADCNDSALALARATLHGGRTEAFRLGRVPGPIYCYDVNSMYPHVMATNHFPAVLRLHCHNPTLDELDRWTRSHAVCARVLIAADEPRYAVKHNGKLVFPCGVFDAWLTTPDIRYALEHGHLARGWEAAVYTAEPLFVRFVTSLYALREQARADGNEVQRWLLKILMNSLFGKFAERGQVWDIIGSTEDERILTWLEYDLPTGRRYLRRQFAGIIQERARTLEARESHPAIAAHVTAYARSLLWELMSTAGRENVIYCDTDSLYVTADALPYLENRFDQGRLGALKLESQHDWIEVNGAKDYLLPGRAVIKGVRAKARWISPDTVQQEQWSSLPGLLRAGSLDAPTTKLICKTLRREYDKGIPQEDGTVRPITLSLAP